VHLFTSAGLSAARPSARGTISKSTSRTTE
jgi:hypothetical protein